MLLINKHIDSIESIELTREAFVDEKKGFAQYLIGRPKGVVEINRESSLGKYLRVMRFYDVFHSEIKKSDLPIHMKGLIALAIVESKGDPLSRNLQNGGGSDGGAGLLHTQPDTARRLGLSTYADKEGMFIKPFTVKLSKKSYIVKKFSDCRYETLIAQGLTHAEAYKIHGEGLVKLKEQTGLNYDTLSALDDRFNHTKNIQSALQYFQKARDSIQAWAKYYNKSLTSQQLELYTLNAYNKGYGWSLGKGNPNPNPRFLAGGSHMKNIAATVQYYNKYNQIVENMLQQNKGHKEIYLTLTEQNSTVVKKGVSQKEKEYNLIDQKDTNNLEKKLKQQSKEEQKKVIGGQVTTIFRYMDQHVPKKFKARLMSSGDYNHVLAISPQGDYHTRYQFGMRYNEKDNRWIIYSASGSIQVEAQGDRIVKLATGLMGLVIESLQYHPDTNKNDIQKGLFSYKNETIVFNKNRSPFDVEVISKSQLEDMLLQSSDKRGNALQNTLAILNDIYREVLEKKS